MSPRRTTSVWIACFAVLFSLLAMPLSPNTPQASGEQALWSTFCSGGGTRLVAVPLGEAPHSIPEQPRHLAMQHCPCCSGSVLVVIPSGFTHGLVARLEEEPFPPAIFLIHTPPRPQWPSANPRASPPV